MRRAAAGLPGHVQGIELEGGSGQADGGGRQDGRIGRRAERGHARLVQRVQANVDRKDQPEGPEGSAEQLGQVIAGDVLDDLPAGLGDRAIAEGDRRTHHEVARGAVAVAQRS
jgi:hypothetical protein